MRNYLVLLVLVLFSKLSAQELNCTVKVNSERVSNTNQQIFKTLESALNEFVNKTKWSNQEYTNTEKINCSMFINISEFNSNIFTATIQVQSARTVFNSTYATPLLNLNDKDFTFRYVEFENLYFNPNSFDSNLVSVIAYYSYVILGIDADSFEPLGGSEYFGIARNVVLNAQSSGFKGWTQNEGLQNRFFLVNDMLSSTYNPIRKGIYEYHILGLDKMADNIKLGKEQVLNALKTVSTTHAVRPNAYLTRIFFDTKADEIVSIFTGGPALNIASMVDDLNKTSPLNASKWSKLKQ